MLCPQCGKEIPEGQTICPSCGQASDPGEKQPDDEKKKRSPDWRAIREKCMDAVKRCARRLGRLREERKRNKLDETMRRRIWYIFTFSGLGLMAVAALVLFLISGKTKKPESPPPETAAAPVIEIINFYTPMDERSLHTEGSVCFAGDELLVISAEGCSYTEMESFCSQRGLRITGHVELCGLYQIRLPGEYSLEELRQLSSQMQQEGQIELAAPNVVWTPAWNELPDDPWGGGARWDGAVSSADNWSVMAIGAPQCWETYEPDPVRVGVIDSAFDTRHEDLRYEVLLSDGGAVSSHGTQSASVIGAVHNNGLGIAGVAENCRIWGFSIPGRCNLMVLLSAIAEMTAQDVRVINLGQGYEDAVILGALSGDPEILDAYYTRPAALFELALTRLLEKGYDFLLVQSAGNGLEGQGVDARWNCALTFLEDEEIRPRILVVGAVGVDEEGAFYQAPFSNRGPRVDLLAPGVEVYCALPGGYGQTSGSSPAAAHVSGVCASILAAKPELSCARVRDLVVSTADIPVTGGDGSMVNMRAAMEAAGAAPYRPAAEEEQAGG